MRDTACFVTGIEYSVAVVGSVVNVADGVVLLISVITISFVGAESGVV